MFMFNMNVEITDDGQVFIDGMHVGKFDFSMSTSREQITEQDVLSKLGLRPKPYNPCEEYKDGSSDQ